MIASVTTGHYFATPFAILFTIGYGYVSALVMLEQASRRRYALAEETVTEPAMLSDRPMASEPPMSGERWVGGQVQPQAADAMSADAA